MKTTIELSDAVLEQTKELARRSRTTMRRIIESALRQYLDEQEKKTTEYRYESASFKGDGVCEGIQEGNWEMIRSMIYERRGG
jgi:hypothetical protein